MTSFLVAGEGEPARSVLSSLVGKPAAKVVALVTAPTDNSLLVNFALKHRIPLKKPDVFTNSEAVASLMRQGIDWLLNANSTVIIPARILESCRCGALNLHPGLLPEYAGLHTHQWAIRNGETEFGATIHFMEASIDSGAIVRQQRCPIRPDDTGLSLFNRCLKVGIELFQEVIAQILDGIPLSATPQDLTKRRLYRHRDSLDGRIDWHWAAHSVAAFIRAGNYRPFKSPTYVATLDRTVDFAIEVLKAEIERPTSEAAGSIINVTDQGLLIACGDYNAIRIVEARNDKRLLDADIWRQYVAQLPSRVLRGRCESSPDASTKSGNFSELNLNR